jgi:amidase
MTDELWRRSALELAAMIRQGEVKATEVIDAHLERIEAINPHLNAIVRVLAHEAHAAANEADLRLSAGDEVGPLHGVPITVKENIDLAGTPTTQGLPALADAVAPIDAPVVERMRAAGAIPIGRTNLPDVGLRVHTDSSLHGLTRNPWHPGRTAGGSSGGEASALASGMSPLGLGNDLGGSLRNPAHCCGIASIKPTTGRVPHASIIPPEDSGIAFQLMAVEGVMARRVADVRAGLAAVNGAHPRDPVALPVPLTVDQPPHPLTVAVVAEPPGGATDAGVAGAVRRAADALADAGYEVVEATPPAYERTLELWMLCLIPDIRLQRPILADVMGADGTRFLDLADGAVPDVDALTWAGYLIERLTVARAWSTFFAEHPLVLSPVWAQPAFPHGWDIESAGSAQATLELMRPVLPANLLGLPAAVTCAGVVDGLPVGVQVMGNRFQDLLCLDAAEVIEAAVGPLTPIDPIMHETPPAATR